MSAIDIIVGFLVPAIFTYILKDFFDMFLLAKYAGGIKHYSIWGLYFFIDMIISHYISIKGIENIFYSFILLSCFCIIIYSGKVKYILFLVLFIICVGVISEMLIGFLTRAFFSSDQLINASLLGSACSKIIILIIIRVIKIFNFSETKDFSFINCLASSVITVGSLYIIYNLYVLNLDKPVILGSILSSVIILLLNVICFRMFDKIAVDAEIRRKNDIYKQTLDIYKRELEEREAFNKRMSRLQHDIKNHYIALEKLAVNKEYNRVLVYLRELSNNNILNPICISGNMLVDGVLGNKFDVAEKYEIEVSCNIEIPSTLPFDDIDLCIIMGNALDNAISGAKMAKTIKSVNIFMKFKQGNFVLNVKNSFDTNSTVWSADGKKLLTSKRDKTIHGMGITLIEETALKYNGIVNIKIEDSFFVLSVLLYQI